MDKPGCIYLVGTGPGETNLITVKGLALVREVDAIVGDTLTHARLLQAARPEAEIYDVGSRRRGAKMTQAEVNRLLLDLAGQGKTVVRLWPGDPFVFGRAALEMRAARQAGLRCELVPGVTSAIAAPAYAGVPVTDWAYGSSFAVVSGFEFEEQPVKANWTALAEIETLVILMPLERLPEIVDRLLAAGRPANTPALVVENGTLPQQKQLLTTLGELAPAIEQQKIESNSVVVIGQVAELAADLAWFYPGPDYPLLGKRVLVTRPVHQAADFMAALRALGVEPISFPTIEIRPVADTRPLDEAIQRLARPADYPIQPTNHLTGQPANLYNWLVLTSANGVVAFWERLEQLGLDSRSLASVRIAAIGPATAAALAQRSIKPDLLPDVYTAEGVLAAFDRLGPVAGQRFLLARADIARQTLAEGLIERGALVDEIPAYRTVPIAGGSMPPAADIVTFTSSSTVQGYVNCLGGRAPAEFLKHSQVVCIGPITAATAAELGVPVNAVAENFTIAGMLALLKEVCR
jgi:uroporphyrinogen III methyltransferase/synthase